MTQEQQEAILEQMPNTAFIFISLAANGKGEVEVHQADLFGNNIAAICSVVDKLKEIQTAMEQESDQAIAYMLTNPREDNDDNGD